MASSPMAVSSPRVSQEEDALTPSRKVQALLAQFDDSDSDNGSATPMHAISRSLKVHNESAEPPSADDSSEDDLPITRPSRMEARLQGNKHANFGPKAVQETSSLQQQKHLADTTGEDQNGSSKSAISSEDELTRPAPRRRLLVKRKASSAGLSSPGNGPSQPASPLFFPSPTAGCTVRMSASPAPEGSNKRKSDASSETPGFKFKALVEKHRRARLEKEAAEDAKRAAARQSEELSDDKPRKQRGSSPADDSDEGSDDSNVASAVRLTKDAKPTRKASKKAIEDMKRETQRMSRNMQLAHQARTKKKITKDSLLARFNFLVSTPHVKVHGDSDQSAAASSEIGSDAESAAAADRDTPPTSPIEDFMDFDKPTLQKTIEATDNVSADASDVVVEAPPLEALGLELPVQLDKGKGKAIDLELQDPFKIRHMTILPPALEKQATMPVIKGKLDVRARVAELLKSRHAKRTHDEMDDLDVITNKGSIRKYAAFEQLPKHKAKETQSHLALRSLAHLHDNERNARSSMTTSEMASSLRRAARTQAREERQLRIAELKAKGVIIQTAEERDRDQQEVEDLVERARLEGAEIQKREKELAKKSGTYVKEGLDDDDSDDEEFEDVDDDADDAEDEAGSEADSDEDSDEEDEDEDVGPADVESQFFDDQAGEADTDEEVGEESEVEINATEEAGTDTIMHQTPAPRKSRTARVVLDDDEDNELVFQTATESPLLPQPCKTPQSVARSARKHIPGLNMSDDLPLGLSQAFEATMADSQTQEEQNTQQDTLAAIRDLPSPGISLIPRLNRLDSLDMISDSQPATQTQPLNITLSLSQSQKIPESPLLGRGTGGVHYTPSQGPFEPTQDEGYMFSPFRGSRFAETPQHAAPHSTIDTVVVTGAIDASPILQRKGRLQRGRVQSAESDDDEEAVANFDNTAFEVMRRAARKSDQAIFDKSKSDARNVVDEAAEESDDEYAGLGGASDDDGNDQENDDDRNMIDHDTQVGNGDEAKLAGLFADRERKSDEAAVSKLLKDITTGALRRKRGANDDLDLSDEEDGIARRREAKRREFAKMRRELLKDEAVGKIAEDKKKEAFLKSIEDREAVSDDEDFDQPETPLEDSQEQPQPQPEAESQDAQLEGKRKRPLETASDSQLNRLPPSLRRTANKKPSTLAEIRESVSFLIEEPDSQAATIDLSLSDSEDEPEAYVDLDRHLKAAEADENAALDDEEDDLDDFIIDDDGLAKDQHESDSQESSVFKKPGLPSQTSRPNFAERRTNRDNVVDRLSLLRQNSSASSNSSTTKQAFYTTANNSSTSSFKVPLLLRRATTNSSVSSFGSSSSAEKVSATGVTTARTERGHASDEKEFIRKGRGGQRNAVNYRPTMKEEKMSARAGVQKAQKGKNLKGSSGKAGFLGGLLRGESWG